MAGGSALALAAWTSDDQEEDAGSVRRHAYGDHPSQWGELHLPARDSRGTVVVIHGGFWREQYDASLGTPLAADLAARGWTCWNLEYRRVGNGGGWPATFDDVALGIDHLAGLDVATEQVITLGHSAGGHLATWAAARGRFERWAPGRVPVTGVVSQAGVLDLSRAVDEGLGAGAVTELLGEATSMSVDEVDPQRQIPLDVPVWAVHAPDDDVVPVHYSEDYVSAAQRAGASAELVQVPGGHFGVIDVTSPAWDRIVAVLDSA